MRRSIVPPQLANATPDDAQLIDASAFARLLSVSLATFNRMKAAGRLPRHITLSSGCHRWNRAIAVAWIKDGCPPVKEWEIRNRKNGGPQR